jgi:1-acyl-sn-glycerol-3-phosphate acyltransferase
VIGSILLWLWVGFWGGLIALANLILFPIFNPLVDPGRRVVGNVSRFWGMVIFWALPRVKVRVEGLEHLKTGGPYVLCANHQSTSDITMVLGFLPHMKFIAKDALFKTPPLCINMRISGYIPARIGKKDANELVGADMKKWLARGVHVIVFAEGTRSPDGKMQRFRQGPFVIAREAGVKVIPVAFHNSKTVLPKNSWKYCFNTEVLIRLLPPIAVAEDPKETASIARAQVQQVLDLDVRSVVLEPDVRKAA